MKEQYSALDGWRGICALFVAVRHFPTTGHISTSAIVGGAHLFVDFFFVLSGFVLTHAYLNRLQSVGDAGFMIWRRLGRLWPLHLAILTGFIGLELTIPLVEWLTGIGRDANAAFAAQGSVPLSALPSHILLLHGLGFHDRLSWNFPSWSISVEFWTCVVFAFAVLATRRRTAVVSLAIAAFGAVIVATYSLNFLATEYDYGLFRCLYGFFVGHLIYRIMPALPDRFRFPNLVELITAVGLFLYLVTFSGTVYELTAPVVLGIVVWVFAREQGAVSLVLKSRPLQLLGLWSYSIYMVHSLLIAVVHRGLTVVQEVSGQKLFIDVVTSKGSQRLLDFGDIYVMDAVTLLYAASVIGLSALTWRWIEMPAQRLWNGYAWTSLKKYIRTPTSRENFGMSSQTERL